jgi:hypothetical protein
VNAINVIAPYRGASIFKMADQSRHKSMDASGVTSGMRRFSNAMQGKACCKDTLKEQTECACTLPAFRAASIRSPTDHTRSVIPTGRRVAAPRQRICYEVLPFEVTSPGRSWQPGLFHSIDRRPTRMRVVGRKLLVYPIQIENAVNLN